MAQIKHFVLFRNRDTHQQVLGDIEKCCRVGPWGPSVIGLYSDHDPVYDNKDDEEDTTCRRRKKNARNVTKKGTRSVVGGGSDCDVIGGGSLTVLALDDCDNIPPPPVKRAVFWGAIFVFGFPFRNEILHDGERGHSGDCAYG